MSNIDKISQTLERGDYLLAGSLIEKHKVIDCESICNSIEINEISGSIDNAISDLETIIDRIGKYELELVNLKGAALQMEQRETAVQVQHKNLSDTCQLVRELIENLTIPPSVQEILFEGDLNDEGTIGKMASALESVEKVLQYNSSMQDMKCVKEQKMLAYSIKAKFSDRFYLYFTSYVDLLLSDFSESFINNRAVVAHNHLLHLEPLVPWVGHIYSSVLVEVKRNFDNFMEKQLAAIREYKPPKQPKCGVLGVVKNFEQFTTQVEALVKNIGIKRDDVDRWYIELVGELFITIDKMEHPKTPSEMIRLENYYYLNDVLRSKKIPCLDTLQKKANSEYNSALDDYVTLHFGQPLKKLNEFFDGIQQKISEGVKEDEISYQLDFSKQKLRERLQMVSLKEVRKGLEEMYKRIEKHVFEPNSSNSLIQVIWRAMQTEFLSQYDKIQRMIERCYPSTSLSLTFTIEDLLQVFSDIAQSH